MIDKTDFLSSYMPNRCAKIFTVVAAFVGCHIFSLASAAASDIVTVTAARDKSQRPLYVYLPDNSTLFQKSGDSTGSLFFNGQKNISRFNTGADQARGDLGSPAPLFYLGQEVRPASSLALGFLPPKGSVNNVPGPYQYATLETDVKDCRTADKPPRTAAETADSSNSNKGIRLPIGWSVEMCLHF